jgi:hypothetical protein
MVKRVSGSCMGTMPASSRTVATHSELDPDMGGVCTGSMMIQPISAWVLGRNKQVHMAKNAAARFVEHEIAQAVILRDPARCSQIVSPGGGATPPTMTSPTSPSAWQPMM